MKKLILLFIFIFSLGKAQTHRFVYEYDYKPGAESTEFEKVNVALDVNPEEVKFYSYELIKVDSLNKVRNTRSVLWDETPTVIRERGTNKNREYVMLNDLFYIDTEDPIQWTLLEETKETGGYKLQKAATHFGGRDWVVWFNPDVPIPEGPYKFRGLPGLIFEAADTENNFHFNLVKSQKLPKTFDTTPLIEKFAGGMPVKTTWKKVNQMRLVLYKDPMHDMRQEFLNNKNPDTKYMMYGIELKDVRQFKELGEMAQKYMRDNNNPIDLTTKPEYPAS